MVLADGEGTRDGSAPQPAEAPRPSSAAGLLPARVFAVEADGRIGVAIGDERLWARQALSCLLVPEAGDRVLVARADGEVFVLAVLDRLLPDAMALAVPGARRVVLAAPDVAIQGRERLTLQGREATVDGETVRVLATSFSLVGRMAAFIADLLRTTARRSETVADALAVQAGERTTRITGADVSEVGTLVRNVDQVSVETAHSAVVSAKEDLRFDGTRVTVG